MKGVSGWGAITESGMLVLRLRRYLFFSLDWVAVERLNSVAK